MLVAGVVAMLLGGLAAESPSPAMAVPLIKALPDGLDVSHLQGDVFMMSEIWGGVMIALSLGAYGADRRTLGAVAALAALVFRSCCRTFARTGPGPLAAAAGQVDLAPYLSGLAVEASSTVMRIAGGQPVDYARVVFIATVGSSSAA